MRIFHLHLPILAMTGLFSTTGLFAAIIYDQPATFPRNQACPCLPSYNSGFGFHSIIVDNFQLAAGAAINAVDWQGTFVGPNFNYVGWTLDFYSDNAGTPGTVLYEQTFPVAAVSTTLVGTTTELDSSGSNVNNFRVVLPSDFSANAATNYWFGAVVNQIVPPIIGGGFFWTAGVGLDGTSKQFQGFAPVFEPVPGDRAFALEAAPEPATFYPLSLLLGIAILKLRQHKHQAGLDKK